MSSSVAIITEALFDKLVYPLNLVLNDTSPIATGTRVHWSQVFEDADVAAAVAHIVEPANEENLTRLAAEVLAP